MLIKLQQDENASRGLSIEVENKTHTEQFFNSNCLKVVKVRVVLRPDVSISDVMNKAGVCGNGIIDR